MNFKALFLAIAVGVQLLTGCSTTNVQDGEQEMAQEKQLALGNTYYKLTTDKELSIAYIGGSVTDGYGSTNQTEKSWAAHLGRWFKEEYPDATIKNNKLSIGGTGSYLAAFRYEREIAPKNPDLLFIEYAVNDKYNGVTYDQVVRSSESIVRLALEKNPAIDIVYVLTFDNGTRDTDYDQLRAHRDVAEYYGFPSIKLADHVYPMLAETGDDFSKYFKDGVHPNDEGYLFYAQRIWGMLHAELAEAAEAEEPEYKNRVLPEKTLAPTLLKNARMIYADEIDLSNAEGWEYQKGTAYSWLGTRYNGRVFAKELGAKFTFEFEGTDIGIASGIGPNMGKVTITVDDREPVVFDEYRGNTNPKDRYIAENLPEGKHTVTVEVTDKNASSGGYEYEIGAFLVS